MDAAGLLSPRCCNAAHGLICWRQAGPGYKLGKLAIAMHTHDVVILRQEWPAHNFWGLVQCWTWLSNVLQAADSRCSCWQTL